MRELIYKEEVYQIVGAAMEVYNNLGCGFLEPVYQEALEIELASRKIPARAQFEFRINYKDRILQKTYIVDFLVYEKILVEIKAVSELTGHEEAQLINYLKASGLQLGLLINFGGKSLQWYRRVLMDNSLSKTQIREISEIRG
jgi:GxxExxY protein